MRATAGLPFLLEEGMEVAFVPPVLDAPRRATVSAIEEQGLDLIVFFEGVEDRSTAEALAGCHCLVRRADLPEGALAVGSRGLVGWSVRDEAAGFAGTVSAVIENPGQTLLELAGNDGRSGARAARRRLRRARSTRTPARSSFPLPAGLFDAVSQAFLAPSRPRKEASRARRDAFHVPLHVRFGHGIVHDAHRPGEGDPARSRRMICATGPTTAIARPMTSPYGGGARPGDEVRADLRGVPRFPASPAAEGAADAADSVDAPDLRCSKPSSRTRRAAALRAFSRRSTGARTVAPSLARLRTAGDVPPWLRTAHRAGPREQAPVRAIDPRPPAPAAKPHVDLPRARAGSRFDDAVACELAREERLLFVCGHYEGIDERAYALADTRDLAGRLRAHERGAGLHGGHRRGGAQAARRAGGARRAPRTRASPTGCSNTPSTRAPPVFAGHGRARRCCFRATTGPWPRWRRERSLERTARLRPDLLENAAPLTAG